MKPSFFVIAALLLGWVGFRWRRESNQRRALFLLVAAGCVVYGTGVIHLPNLEKLIEHVGTTLGKWTYLLVGVMAFLETGAFIGLIAPGETVVLVGGLVAGQGTISVVVLIALVWACAVSGDVVSYLLGRRLGREFMVRHGPKVKITEERLHQVEGFFDKHGGKTILIGRFVGLVRAIAPFLAGSSRMPFKRFIPYDVVGAGLWGSAYVLLGYIFWQSFNQVVAVAKKGATALAVVIVVVVGAIVAYRYLRVPENRAAARKWIDEQARRPGIAPVARAVRPVWHRVLAPAGHHLARPARFVWERLTPGQLGLELTTLLAVGLVGAFAFVALAGAVGAGPLGIDRTAFTVGDNLRGAVGLDVARALTWVGSLPVSGGIVALAVVALLARRHVVEGLTIGTGLALTVVAVHLAKAAEDRPRPPGSFVHTTDASFPSGHSAYAIGLIAVAVALRHAAPSVLERFALVTVAVALAVVVGATRIYLRAHYLSDVVAGYGLSAAIFAACAITGLAVAFVRHNGRREP